MSGRNGRRLAITTTDPVSNAAGLLGSMARVSSSVDNTMIESFWSTMQGELLDRRAWANQAELASATWNRSRFHNSVQRHSSPGCRSLKQFEDLHTAAVSAA